jgi:hypothetical protein
VRRTGLLLRDTVGDAKECKSIDHLFTPFAEDPHSYGYVQT